MSAIIKFKDFSNIFILTVIVFSIGPSTFAQQCRSYNRQIGNCVSIQLCNPLLAILKNNPTPLQLRQLQRLTCGFDTSDPKVCCPIKSITGYSTTTEAPAHEASTEEPTALPRFGAPNKLDFRSHPAFKSLPDLKDCGIGIGQDRIIGGKNVSHGTYPWMARIGYRSPNSNRIDYYCGGTIISKRYILTAAHCTDGVDDEYAPVEVLVAEHNTGVETDCNLDLQQCSTAQTYRIAKLLPHKDYSSNTKQNDISLIRLDRDISFDSLFMKPVCLPFVHAYEIEQFSEGVGKGIVAGWGRTQWNKAEGSHILQEVTLPLKTNAECQMVYNRRVTITDLQLCAGGETGQDSCGGDSGGPLMKAVPAKNVPRVFQLGVVSFGPVQCGAGGLPGVYARTTAYLKWILDTISEDV